MYIIIDIFISTTVTWNVIDLKDELCSLPMLVVFTEMTPRWEDSANVSSTVHRNPKTDRLIDNLTHLIISFLAVLLTYSIIQTVLN